MKGSLQLMAAKMPREIAVGAGDVLNTPAPPVPAVPAPYAMRLADPDRDAQMVSEWMNRPHLATTWHYDRPPEKWHRHLSMQFQGTFSRPFIISHNGDDFIYLELFRAARDCIASLYYAQPYDIGVHAAIADPNEISKGHALHLMPLVATSLFGQELQCRRIMFETQHVNMAARRFCERLGCLALGEHRLPHGLIALYAYPRSPEHTPQSQVGLHP